MNLKEEINKNLFWAGDLDREEPVVPPDWAIMTAEAYAKEKAFAFAEWCNRNGWLFRKGIGNWTAFNSWETTKTTEELYKEWGENK